jgi:serine/threonine protein kinase
MPSTLFCDSCGAANQPQASFCRTCGQKLQVAGTASRDTTTGRLLTHYMLQQRYRILDTVGKGGMGAVYRAEDTQLGNRSVAVKEMSQSGLDPQQVAEASDAFKLEAHLLAGLHHPNLPDIYDHFSEGRRWYLVMTFIQGETLEDRLSKARDGKLAVEEVLQIGIQLCTVLSYLHTRQPPIIFRDLKPSNILLTQDRHLYLIDFGIARHFKPGQAKDTAAYGSQGYASPEQYGKAQTTSSSDIYSLGVVLHQSLSGQDPSLIPFHLPSLENQTPALSAQLITLVSQMVDMDARKRPASAEAVKRTLEQVTQAAVSNTPRAIFPAEVAKLPDTGKRLSRRQSDGPEQLMVKPQPPRPQPSRTAVDDSVVIGGGREKNYGVMAFLLFIGFFPALTGLMEFLASSTSGKLAGSILLPIGLAVMALGIVSRNYGKRLECLKIGSGGIEHYLREKGSVFIPWTEMSRAYVDVHYFFDYLYVVLERDSNLFFKKSISRRYEANIGSSGAIMICQVSGSSSALIPKHTVERALRKYAPSAVQ